MVGGHQKTLDNLSLLYALQLTLSTGLNRVLPQRQTMSVLYKSPWVTVCSHLQLPQPLWYNEVELQEKI